MFGINGTIRVSQIGVAVTLLPSGGSFSHRHHTTIDSHEYCYSFCFTSHLPEKQSSFLLKKKKRMCSEIKYIDIVLAWNKLLEMVIKRGAAVPLMGMQGLSLSTLVEAVQR
jgi:hypothetical protein